jgi:DNA-binding PadR family transcriptional regulator
MFAPGELRLLLLSLIADASRHGYELIKTIEELTGGRYAPSPGVVYPTLSLLLDEGAIEEVGEGAPRRAFTATAMGRAELAERGEEAEQLLSRLRVLAAEGPGDVAPPIVRATANLMAALRGRLSAGELNRETIHAIAEILDEAARRVERL